MVGLVRCRDGAPRSGSEIHLVGAKFCSVDPYGEGCVSAVMYYCAPQGRDRGNAGCNGGSAVLCRRDVPITPTIT